MSKCLQCKKDWFSGIVLKDGSHVCSCCYKRNISPSTSDTPEPDNSHYTKGSIEPWQYIIANNLNFFEGSAVKYITRWRHKNGLEDLLKAEVYIKELIRQEREK